MFSFILFQILIQEGVEQQEAKEAAEQQEVVDEEKGVDNEQSKEEVSEEQEVEDGGEVPDNKDGDGTTKYLWKIAIENQRFSNCYIYITEDDETKK